MIWLYLLSTFPILNRFFLKKNLSVQEQSKQLFSFRKLANSSLKLQVHPLDIQRAQGILHNRFELEGYTIPSSLTVNWLEKVGSNHKYSYPLFSKKYFNRVVNEANELILLSEFSFVFDLIKAYHLTHDTQYALKFWTLVSDWIHRNPFMQTAHWFSPLYVQRRVFPILLGFFYFYDFCVSSEQEKMVLDWIEKVYWITQLSSDPEAEIELVLKHCTLLSLVAFFPQLSNSLAVKKESSKIILDTLDKLYNLEGVVKDICLDDQCKLAQLWCWLLTLEPISNLNLGMHRIRKLEKNLDFLTVLIHPSTGRFPFGEESKVSSFLGWKTGPFDGRYTLQWLSLLLKKKRMFDPLFDDLAFWMGFSGTVNAELVPKTQIQFAQEGLYIYSFADIQIYLCSYKAFTPLISNKACHLEIWGSEGVLVGAQNASYGYNGPRVSLNAQPVTWNRFEVDGIVYQPNGLQWTIKRFSTDGITHKRKIKYLHDLKLCIVLDQFQCMNEGVVELKWQEESNRRVKLITNYEAINTTQHHYVTVIDIQKDSTREIAFVNDEFTVDGVLIS